MAAVPITHWLTLLGSTTIGADGIRFIPTPAAEAPAATPTTAVATALSWAIVKSGIFFQKGIIEFEAKLTGADNKCQIILNQGLDKQLFIGLNIQPNAFGMIIFKNSGGWEAVGSPTAATGESPPPLNEWLTVRVEVNGSNVRLFVNGIEVASAQFLIQQAQIAMAFAGTTEIHVRNVRTEAEKPKAFVVMQFTEDYNALYRDVIKPVCQRFDYECVRADDICLNGQIIEDITRSIREASVVIADITPNNPNVFYEVGYSHAIGKPTILLSDKTREKLPFDVSGFRTLFYENSIGGKSLIEEMLTKHLKNITAPA